MPTETLSKLDFPFHPYPATCRLPSVRIISFRLTFVNHGQYAEDLDLSHVTSGDYTKPDLAHIQWVVVTRVTGVRVHVLGVLPRAREAAVVEEDVPLFVAASIINVCVTHGNDHVCHGTVTMCPGRGEELETLVAIISHRYIDDPIGTGTACSVASMHPLFS